MFLDSILYHEIAFYSCASTVVFVNMTQFTLTSGTEEAPFPSFTLFSVFLAIL